MASRSLPFTPYQFARAFAFAWFRLNKIEVKEAASASKIAKTLRCWDGKGGNGRAKAAIIDWHEKALTTNKTEPEVRIDEDFYASQSWRKARYAALRRCHGACELCGSPPGEHALHVDHIKPRSKFPEFALDPSNLQVLCRDCNLGKSNTDCIDWRGRQSVPERIGKQDHARRPSESDEAWSTGKGWYSEKNMGRRLREMLAG